jgi:hypothetical protein
VDGLVENANPLKKLQVIAICMCYK